MSAAESLHPCEGGCGKQLKWVRMCNRCGNVEKAGPAAEVAEAFHRIHVSWARSAIGSYWQDCYSCCVYARRGFDLTQEILSRSVVSS